MTIAAGFVSRDGVVLCADSQQEGGAMKIYAPKVGLFEFAAGKVGYAFAGNSAFAVAAIQKCSVRLQAVTDPAIVVQEIEKVLDRQYRKTVYAHPDRSTDWSIPYWLLLSYWHPGHGTFLFATHETIMRSVVTFECTGIGKELGTYLIAPTFDVSMSQQEATLLSSYMLARVKSYVPGCGGPSIILAMRNDGNAEFLEFSTLCGADIWRV